MQWIKASERLPENDKAICLKMNGGYQNAFVTTRKDGSKVITSYNNMVIKDWKAGEWLDESPSPSLPETEQGNEQFLEEMTAIMREADQRFEMVGGGTRHYMRDIFLPMMEERGLLIVKRHSKIETSEPMPEFNESIENMDADSKIFVDKSMAIASRIKQCLNERGMQQKDLANLLEKTDSEISKWLAGMHNLTLRNLVKVGGRSWL